MSTKKGPKVRVPLIVFAGSRSLPAQLWKRQGSSATIWCTEPMETGLRCDTMLEGISAGVPVLVRIEVLERSEPIEHEGNRGYVHLVELAFLRRDDQRKLDVWMRAAMAAKKDEPARKSARDKVQRTKKKRRRSADERRGRRAGSSRTTSRAVVGATFPAGPRQVLLVEGGRSNAETLAQALDPSGHDFVVESVWTLSELKGRLKVGRVHLVLLDPDLPDSRGLATVQEAVKAARGVPIVVLRGRQPKGFEVKCLLAGAARVMRQDAMGPTLARRVLGLLGVSTKPRRRTRPPLPDANPRVAKPAPKRDRPRRPTAAPTKHPPAMGVAAPVIRAELEPPEPVAPAPEPQAPEPPAPEPQAPVSPPPVEPPSRAPVHTNPPIRRAETRTDKPLSSMPQAPETMVAELWWHEDGYAAIWCNDSLRIGLRCELMLDPEEQGEPKLYDVEVVRAHHKRSPDGRSGFLHEAKLTLSASQPEARPTVPMERKTRPVSRQAPASPSLGASFRVVLVENNPSYGPSVLRKELGRVEGVLIETRSSIAGLRARLRRDGVNLILVELDMPDTTGLDTAQTVLGYAGGVPVVGISEAVTPALEAGCTELGIEAVVDKASDRETLLAVIERFRSA